MKARRWAHQAVGAIAAALLVALSDAPVAAQCAMCRTALEGASGGASLAKSLNWGIIVLLIPPVTIFCAIFITAYKRGKTPTDVSKNVP